MVVVPLLDKDLDNHAGSRCPFGQPNPCVRSNPSRRSLLSPLSSSAFSLQTTRFFFFFCPPGCNHPEPAFRLQGIWVPPKPRSLSLHGQNGRHLRRVSAGRQVPLGGSLRVLRADAAHRDVRGVRRCAVGTHRTVWWNKREKNGAGLLTKQIKQRKNKGVCLDEVENPVRRCFDDKDLRSSAGSLSTGERGGPHVLRPT